MSDEKAAPEQPTPTLTAPVEPPVTRGPDYRIIFTNQSRMRLSPTEIALTFGYLDQLANAPGPFIEEKVTLVFTPQHAKVLARSLTEIMKVYEDRYGTIDTSQMFNPTGLDPDAVRAAMTAAQKSD